ncbi:DUF2169 family type VI secretion system accessory protein [Chondromyces apiculatus]|uniref:DUF2169 domain-containing protein n=1 Tax=Chondromyces apiculatus DSM 436 TaxID=1192034 RepID=A0A017T9F6_9BACT|nr:DUF2169 domain-containing protein [Chondromyces apiculatus]EYF05450.1 Hypothetical protein CAP_3177 [Chondromyces apiculatus DSM 436]
MDVISLSSPRTAGLVWQPKPGSFMLSVLYKVTFTLSPSRSELAPTQDPVVEADNHWNDDEWRSLHSASDLIPTKPRAEVVLVGQAFAPKGQPVRSLIAGFTVGTTEKSIEVMCDRHFTQDGALHEGQRFTRMPLVYERASGGPGTWNLAGIRHGVRDAYGRMGVPNLQPPGVVVHAPEDFVEPVGFGPMAPTWPVRREKLGLNAASFTTSSLAYAPLPEGFNYAFFNVAPPDQWVDALRDNERIVLENLHPDHPRLVTSLPGIRPRAFVDGRQGATQALEMRPDTLLIDTDRGVCSLLFRGILPLSHASESGRVLIAMEQGLQTLTYADVERMARKGGGDVEVTALNVSPRTDPPPMPTMKRAQTLVAPMDHARSSSLPFAQPGAPPAADDGRAPKNPGGLPFMQPGASPAGDEARVPQVSGGLPFMQSGVFPAGDEGRAPKSGGGLPFMQSGALPAVEEVRGPQGAGGLPFGASPGGAPAPSSVPSPPSPSVPPASPAAPAPPAAMPSPAPVAPPAPVHNPAASSFSGMGSFAPPAAVSPPPLYAGDAAARMGAVAAPASVAAVGAMSPWASGAPRGDAFSAPVAPAPVGSPPSAPRGPVGAGLPGSAAAASDAAADASSRPILSPMPVGSSPASLPAVEKSPRVAAGEVLDLIWYDDAYVPRVRAWWEELVTALDFEPSDPRRDLGVEDPEKARSRHNVFGIMSDAPVIDTAGVAQAIVEAVGERGRFNPPLALVGGELRFPFDEVETLRAHIVTITPMVGSDKRLKDNVDSVSGLLKTDYFQGSTGVAEKVTRELREQFREVNRALPASYLDTHVERLLLEQRHYSIRKVFGGEFIRALLVAPSTGGGGSGAEGAIPVYLPKHLDQTLPMLVVMKARLIVSAHLQQDPYEASPYALRAVALGRSLQLEGLRGAASWRGSGR